MSVAERIIAATSIVPLPTPYSECDLDANLSSEGAGRDIANLVSSFKHQSVCDFSKKEERRNEGHHGNATLLLLREKTYCLFSSSRSLECPVFHQILIRLASIHGGRWS